MPSRHPSALTVFAVSAVAACALALSGCAATTSSPAAAAPDAPLEVEAAWLSGGEQIGVVTRGSSNCAPIPTATTRDADGSLSVTLAAHSEAAACRKDSALRVSLVTAPAEVTPNKDLTIHIAYGEARAQVELGGDPRIAVTDHEAQSPSAGWFRSNAFVLLTWGSSSCPPQVTEVTSTDRTTVNVVFDDVAAICTLDMAPRATVVSVPSKVDGEGAVVVLRGTPEFDGIRVPILGDN